MYYKNDCVIEDEVYVHFGNRKNGNKSNVGYIISDRIYIYDTSYSPAFFEKLLLYFEQYHKKIVIILSHHHSDHVGGLRNRLSKVKADIICTESTSDKFGNKISNIKICSDFIQLNESIYVKRIVKCHTQEDLVLIDNKNKVLFMGDILLDGHHPLLYNNNLEQWIYYLKKCYKMKFVYYVPGHGINMTSKTLKDYIIYLELLNELCVEQRDKINRVRINKFLDETSSFHWLHIENLFKNLEIEKNNKFEELGVKILL